MVRPYEPKAILIVALLAVVFPTFVAWDTAAAEQAGGAADVPTLQSSAKEEAEFEANIKSLVSERQRLDDARARLAAMKLRVDRTAKTQKPEKTEAPKPEPTAPVEPQQSAQRDEAAPKALEIPLNIALASTNPMKLEGV